MTTIVLLAEDVLTDHDVARLVQLHEPEPLRVHVVVPVDTEHNALVETLDEVALGRLKDAVRGRAGETPEQAEVRARTALDRSVSQLTVAGAETTGDLAGDDPVPHVCAVVEELDADEVVVLTQPHPVEDALHRDWASRLRDRLHRPVLHAISGTDQVVS